MEERDGMQFSIPQDQLKHALEVVTAGVGRATYYSGFIGSLLMSADVGRLTFTVADYETILTYTVPDALVVGGGEAVVPAKLFKELAEALPQESVDVTANLVVNVTADGEEQEPILTSTLIRCKRSRSKLKPTCDAEAFPLVEEAGGEAGDTFYADHFANFIDAVRSRKHEDLNADILEGHLSSALCHLGNISWSLGKDVPLADVKRRAESYQAGDDDADTLQRFATYLKQNQADPDNTTVSLGPSLVFDPVNASWSRVYPYDPPETYHVNKDGIPVAGKAGEHPWAMHTFGAVVCGPVRDEMVVACYPAHMVPGVSPMRWRRCGPRPGSIPPGCSISRRTGGGRLIASRSTSSPTAQRTTATAK